MTPPTPILVQIAIEALEDFSRGLSHGDWVPFLDRVSDDFTFWFPAGPFQGWNVGKARAAEFFASVSRVFPEGLTLSIERITTNETIAIANQTEGFGGVEAHPPARDSTGSTSATRPHPPFNGDTVMFEVRSQGLMMGRPYQNQAAIAFDIRDGKVCAYREYLGVIFQLGK